MPNASRKVPFVAAISVMRSRPRAVSTRATIGTSGSRLAVSITWSTDSTIASMIPPTEVPASISRSSAHQRVPNPLTRTQSVLPSPSHRRRCRARRPCPWVRPRPRCRARRCRRGSARPAANRSYCAPLTSSQLLASTGSMRNPGSEGSGSAGVAGLVVHGVNRRLWRDGGAKRVRVGLSRASRRRSSPSPSSGVRPRRRRRLARGRTPRNRVPAG